MKEAELRQHADCSVCGNKVLGFGLPLFWRVTVERFWIDLDAVGRQSGLAVAMGSSGLAAALGPDEDMASPLMKPVTLTVCERCAMDDMAMLAQLALGDPNPPGAPQPLQSPGDVDVRQTINVLRAAEAAEAASAAASDEGGLPVPDDIAQGLLNMLDGGQAVAAAAVAVPVAEISLRLMPEGAADSEGGATE